MEAREIGGSSNAPTVIVQSFDVEAHNQFVEIFFETGLVGLFSFVCFWLSIAAMAIKQEIRTRVRKVSMENGVRAFRLIMFIGVTLVALFDQSFNAETVAFSHLMLSAFVVSAPAKATSESPLGLSAPIGTNFSN
jgi:O-antigen ligase